MKEFNKSEKIRKSKKPSGKGGNKSKFKSEESKDAKLDNVSQYGNPNWYFTDHELAEQASRFSFRSFIGDGVLTGNATLPSIAIFSLNPSLGGYVDPTDSTAAVNLMARKLYAQLSNKSGRTASYAPQDIMTLILAMGEIVSYASYLRRAFGLAFTYNLRNRDLPKNLLKAMGIHPDDLFTNLAPYRVKYNTILNQANKIPIPANLTWFQKCDAIYQTVYADSPDAMAELYAFVPATTWKLNETKYEGGSILETTAAANSIGDTAVTPRTMASHISTLGSMIDALLTSSTFNIIYADILNYSSANNVPLLHLDIVDELYSVTPVYDEEALLHIHNMGIMCNAPTMTTLNIEDAEEGLYTPYNDVYPSAANNNLTYMPLFELLNSSELEVAPLPVLNDMDIVDYPYGNPDLTQRIEATRFSFRLDPDVVVPSGKSSLYVRFAAVADHYCVGMTLYNAGVVNGLPVQTNSILLRSVLSGVVTANIEKFRFHPMQYVIDTGYTEVQAVTGEVNYFTKLDAEWLNRLNTLCFQGLFELR